ncbi:hypothetical protein HUO13_12085 [Saccharopolyspora erythraea]|uniref:hypothetical protein n=1 Tax=Saccharopolyspora erythraea TaxID=1836 RepID=UPI001BA4F6D7|nr:hypothetical protein [Saccharopolyspora erythraea]QUH01452.1 hypothetical protein HUO13_12085 [Saccharopolyspora erythraea]
MKTFPDVEEWLIAYLGDVAPVYTVTPAQINGTVIQVNRVGGSSDLITDRPRVEIAVYVPEGAESSARAEAWRITEIIRNRIDEARGKVAGGKLCDNGRIDNPPQLRPDANTSLRLVVTTVQLSFRRQ